MIHGNRNLNLIKNELEGLFRKKVSGVSAPWREGMLAGPDPHVESYFHPVFQNNPIVEHPELMSSLVTLWEAHGWHDLVQLESEFRKIQQQLRKDQDIGSGDVSNFIYPMY